MATRTFNRQEELTQYAKLIVKQVAEKVELAKSQNAIFIHTSDRLSYKKCRRRWNWVSKIRHNYRPIQRAMALDFGTSMHAALEVLYSPQTWFLRDTSAWQVVEETALRTFRQTMLDIRNAYLAKTNQPALFDEELAEFDEHFQLGQGMLKHYFAWSANKDHFTPVATELDFVVYLFDDKITGRPVYYRGKIDLLVMDADGNFWIWDHKTLGKWMDTEHLDFDEQLGSYNWAVSKMLGIPVVGNVYNELWKAVPTFPTLMKRSNKGRLLSTAKDNPVTYDIMIAAIQAYGENEAAYEEYLDWLKAEGPQFFRRTQFHRNRPELDDIHKRILVESMEMVTVTDEQCYPNPDRFRCTYCAFRAPCLAVNDGSDVEWILQTNYTVGEDTPTPLETEPEDISND